MEGESKEEYSTEQKIWWGILLALLTLALVFRQGDIRSGNPTFFDTVLFLVWIALCLAPLFKVVDLFGVRLRREVESLKEKLEVEIGDLRAEVKSSIETQISPSFYFPYPTSDQQIDNIEKYIEKSVDSFLESRGMDISDVQREEDLNVDNDTLLMFRARYNVEKELRRIWRSKFDPSDRKHPLPVPQISQQLANAGVIDDGVAGSVREVYRISSPAVHGEEIDENQAELIKDVAPSLVNTLKSVE